MTLHPLEPLCAIVFQEFVHQWRLKFMPFFFDDFKLLDNILFRKQRQTQKLVIKFSDLFIFIDRVLERRTCGVLRISMKYLCTISFQNIYFNHKYCFPHTQFRRIAFASLSKVEPAGTQFNSFNDTFQRISHGDLIIRHENRTIEWHYILMNIFEDGLISFLALVRHEDMSKRHHLTIDIGVQN